MPITDVTPPDYSTTLGQVRLLIPDTEKLANPANPSATAEYLFNDSQVTAFLSLYASNVKKAAAQAILLKASTTAPLSVTFFPAPIPTSPPAHLRMSKSAPVASLLRLVATEN